MIESHESEYYIIGSILLQPEVLSEIDIISSEFHYPETRMIFSAIKEVAQRKLTPDIISVSEMLRVHTQSNWMPNLAVIQKNQPSAKLVQQHVSAVRNANMRRKAVDIIDTLTRELDGEAGTEAIDQAITKLMDIRESKKIMSVIIAKRATRRLKK